MITYSKDKNQNIDWNEAAVVFERAPLGKRRREPEKIRRAFESSYAIVYVFDEDKLISKGLPFCLFGDIYYRHMSFLKIRGLICIDQPLSFNY